TVLGRSRRTNGSQFQTCCDGEPRSDRVMERPDSRRENSDWPPMAAGPVRGVCGRGTHCKRGGSISMTRLQLTRTVLQEVAVGGAKWIFVQGWNNVFAVGGTDREAIPQALSDLRYRNDGSFRIAKFQVGRVPGTVDLPEIVKAGPFAGERLVGEIDAEEVPY